MHAGSAGLSCIQNLAFMNASTSASGLILAAFSRLDSSMSISVGSNNSRKMKEKNTTRKQNRPKVHPKFSIGPKAHAKIPGHLNPAFHKGACSRKDGVSMSPAQGHWRHCTPNQRVEDLPGILQDSKGFTHKDTSLIQSRTSQQGSNTLLSYSLKS